MQHGHTTGLHMAWSLPLYITVHQLFCVATALSACLEFGMVCSSPCCPSPFTSFSFGWRAMSICMSPNIEQRVACARGSCMIPTVGSCTPRYAQSTLSYSTHVLYASYRLDAECAWHVSICMHASIVRTHICDVKLVYVAIEMNRSSSKHWSYTNKAGRQQATKQLESRTREERERLVCI